MRRGVETKSLITFNQRWNDFRCAFAVATTRVHRRKLLIIQTFNGATLYLSLHIAKNIFLIVFDVTKFHFITTKLFIVVVNNFFPGVPCFNKSIAV